MMFQTVEYARNQDAGCSQSCDHINTAGRNSGRKACGSARQDYDACKNRGGERNREKDKVLQHTASRWLFAQHLFRKQWCVATDKHQGTRPWTRPNCAGTLLWSLVGSFEVRPV